MTFQLVPLKTVAVNDKKFDPEKYVV